MDLTDDLRALVKRAQRDLDEWSDFFEHTKAVWRGFQFWVNAGETFRAQNTATLKTFTEKDLLGLSQYYITEFLAPLVLQRYLAAFEMFVFEFLRILLRSNPARIGPKEFTLSELLSKGDIKSVIEDSIDEKLNQIRYKKPTEWFAYVNSIERLGCPSQDEIEAVAEMKATRDLIEHNSGVVNRIYLEKAGAKARFKEGEYVEVSDPYLHDSWKLLKKICNDLVSAAIKVLVSKK